MAQEITVKQVSKFVNGTVKYDPLGQYFWLVNKKGEYQMFLELRGWGRIQNLFPKSDEDAKKFQDLVGEWVAQELNKALTKLAQTMSDDPKFSEGLNPDQLGSYARTSFDPNQMTDNNHPLNTPKVGDYIKGSWRDEDTGKTFYAEGTVREYPAGLFVQFEDEGITPLNCFFHFSEIRSCNHPMTNETNEQKPQEVEAKDQERLELATIILKYNDSGETSPNRLARLIQQYYDDRLRSSMGKVPSDEEIERCIKEIEDNSEYRGKWDISDLRTIAKWMRSEVAPVIARLEMHNRLMIEAEKGAVGKIDSLRSELKQAKEALKMFTDACNKYNIEILVPEYEHAITLLTPKK